MCVFILPTKMHLQLWIDKQKVDYKIVKTGWIPTNLNVDKAEFTVVGAKKQSQIFCQFFNSFKLRHVCIEKSLTRLKLGHLKILDDMSCHFR